MPPAHSAKTNVKYDFSVHQFQPKTPRLQVIFSIVIRHGVIGYRAIDHHELLPIVFLLKYCLLYIRRTIVITLYTILPVPVQLVEQNMERAGGDIIVSLHGQIVLLDYWTVHSTHCIRNRTFIALHQYTT
jgi:hypothetical protein